MSSIQISRTHSRILTGLYNHVQCEIQESCGLCGIPQETNRLCLRHALSGRFLCKVCIVSLAAVNMGDAVKKE